MKYQLFFLALILNSIQFFGQNFKSDFDRYCETGDTIKQLEVLKSWEIQDPSNAELFTSYFNYYFRQSKQEYISFQTEMPEGESLVMEDSTGNTAYFGNETAYLPNIMEKGIAKIDEGIRLHPNRLDMRFGKIYALGQMEDWQRFTAEIIGSIQYSQRNNNEWTWTNQEKKEDGEEFFLSSLQDYQLNLYNTGNDDLLKNMRAIAQEILKIYPEHIESLSNLSITYLLLGEYDKGIEPLLLAEKIDPKDDIVLGNIAQAYRLKKEPTKAIQYYEKMLIYGDERSKAFAQQQILELKK